VNRPANSDGWKFWAGVVLAASSAALFATAFRSAIGAVLHAVSGETSVVAAFHRLPFWVRLAAPACGGFLAGVVGLVAARLPASHGVGDVMEAVVLGRVRLSMRVTLLKSLASWLAIVSGGSLGREGPLIQFGGAAGQRSGELLRLPADRIRLLIAAGTAAGFAAAYNTPFAAVLFVIEVVMGVVVIDALLPVLLATVIATAIARIAAGPGPIYGERAFQLQSPLEFVAFAGLGLVTALAAQGFMRIIAFAEKSFHRSWFKNPWRPAIGAALAAVIIAFIPEVAGNGYEPLNELLDGRFGVAFLMLLLAGKCLATASCVSSGSPGGVFTPTLLIGGIVGYSLAVALTAAGIPLGSPGGYALVGMASATAATTHAPLMAAVLVFELSSDYAIALPLILAVAVATLVSRMINRESIYAGELRRRGVEWELTMEGRSVRTR